jgi:hypothetical protein
VANDVATTLSPLRGWNRETSGPRPSAVAKLLRRYAAEIGNLTVDGGQAWLLTLLKNSPPPTIDFHYNGRSKKALYGNQEHSRPHAIFG